MRGSTTRWLLVSINASVAAILLAAAGWLIDAARAAADEAVRMYGHNVDSGAMGWFLAIFFLAPAATFFVGASIAFWRRWRSRWIFQATPVAWLGFMAVFSYVRFETYYVVAGAFATILVAAWFVLDFQKPRDILDA